MTLRVEFDGGAELYLREYPAVRDSDGEPCESCGRPVWWWDAADPTVHPGAFFEHPGRYLGLGPKHDPERCRWWRGDPSTSWGEPTVSK